MEQKTFSLLAFLRPLVREAREESSSLKMKMKKCYWANVSEASIQSEDTEPSVLRRKCRRRKRRRTLEAALGESLRFLEREQRFCRRL